MSPWYLPNTLPWPPRALTYTSSNDRGAVRCPNCEEGRRDMKEYYRMKRLHHNYYARLYYGGSGYY